MKIQKEMFKNKRTQKSFFFLVVLVVIASIFGYWLVNKIAKEEFNIPNYLNLEILLFPSKRAEGFSISGGADYPVFTNRIVIDPAASPSLSNVKNGEKQVYSIWVKDPSGIEKVIASIETDKKEETIEMYLVEGTREEGRWIGSWKTRDIILKDYYETSFLAINTNGNERSIYIPWHVER